MPRPKNYDNQSEYNQVWKKQNVDRVPVNLRKDAEINKAVLQKAAAASGQSLAGFIMSAIAYYIPSALGDDWLEKNGNNSGAGGD